ncbi:MAG: hypothetical protein MJ000_04580 [Bacteroidales bacterium]|nr:hypothetical protein [Bacteroidales bacterium]
METLKYKGFIGSIEAELDDDTLYGKVLGLDKKTLIYNQKIKKSTF